VKLAKLVHVKGLSIPSEAYLFEKDRTSTFEPNGENDEQEGRGENEER